MSQDFSEKAKIFINRVKDNLIIFINDIIKPKTAGKVEMDSLENSTKLICIIISTIIWVFLILLRINIFISLFILLIVWVYIRMSNALLKGFSVRVSEKQFPKVYELVKDYFRSFDSESEIPLIYIRNEGDFISTLLNKIAYKDQIFLSSSVVELLESGNEDAFKAIVGPEIGHILLKHNGLFYKGLVLPSLIIPFLGTAYKRGCQYSADRYALALIKDQEKTAKALSVLAAERLLYKDLNVQSLIKQAQGFWYHLLLIFSYKPFIVSRICKIKTNKPYYLDV